MSYPFLKKPKKLPGSQLHLESLVDINKPHMAKSKRDLINLAGSFRKAVVAVGGGAGEMGEAQGLDIGTFLALSLGGSQCDAAILAGATMVHHRPQPGLCARCDEYRIHCEQHPPMKPKPGVMQVLSELSLMGARTPMLGIVPAIFEPAHYESHILIADEDDEDFYTVVDKRCPTCLMLYHTPDDPKISWWEERLAVLQYMALLRNEADKSSLHLFFNGGNVTEREIRFLATIRDMHNPWWVLLVEDSGRMTQELADNVDFRKNAGNPHIVSCTQADLARTIHEMGFAPKPII